MADTEFWIERAIQGMKEELRNRLMQRPEVLYANTLQLDNALARLARDPASNVQSFDQLCPEYRARPLVGPAYDPGSPITGTQLQHQGKRPHHLQRNARLQEVLNALQRLQGRPVGLQTEHEARSCQIFIHTQLRNQAEELITSRLHGRSRTRISYWVLLQLQGPRGGVQLHVARVERYLRVTAAPMRQQEQQLRLAVCTVFRQKPMREGMHVIRQPDVLFAERAYDVEDIVTLLVSAQPGQCRLTRQRDVRHQGEMLFMQYNKFSRL